MDSVIQHGKERNETDAACIMVDRISSKYPVIIMADRGYENYNLFAHIEGRHFQKHTFNKRANIFGTSLKKTPKEILLEIENIQVFLFLKTGFRKKE